MLNIQPKPKPIKIIKVKKRKPKSARRLLEQKLDSVCREIALDRDNGCVNPAFTRHNGARTSGHLISRTRESVRWDLYNVHEQCGAHNMLHEHFPERYTNWFIGRFGAEEYARLVRDAERVGKLQLYELQELLEQMKKIRQVQLVKALAGEPWKPYFSQADILSGAWSK